MNELKIFKNEQFGKIRVIDEMFVAADVAIALGYRMASDMSRRLDDDEKDTRLVRTPSGDQDMIVITESGLYNAVLCSQLPAARDFKRWITREVIPSIRQHGAYMTPETIEKVLADPDTIIQLATRLKEANAEKEAQQTYIAALEPKAEFFDAVAGSRDAISIGDAAKVLDMGVGQNRLFDVLRRKQILQDNNIPYQNYIDRGYFRVVEQKFVAKGETRISIKTLVSQRGLDYIRKMLQKEETQQIMEKTADE